MEHLTDKDKIDMGLKPFSFNNGDTVLKTVWAKNQESAYKKLQHLYPIDYPFIQIKPVKWKFLDNTFTIIAD